MKQFSKNWKSSKKPGKKRKYAANAPAHIQRKFLSANLNKKLRKKYGRRSFPLKEGDTVKVMRGEFKGKDGKVENIDKRTNRIVVEGIRKEKKGGEKIIVSFPASNLQTQKLNLDDKKRKKALQRGGGSKEGKSDKNKSKSGGKSKKKTGKSKSKSKKKKKSGKSKKKKKSKKGSKKSKKKSKGKKSKKSSSSKKSKSKSKGK